MTRVAFLDLGVVNAELADELESAMRRVLRSGWYVRGPKVDRFEQEFAELCDVPGAVGVANGLEALQLALIALGVEAGDEVIVSAHTSIATWLAITHAGARPVPVDADEETMLIDPARAESAITDRTGAILPVHLYGMPVDLDPLLLLARKHGLALLEDASQAHGARWQGRPIGSLGDAAAFSLYPTKNLGAIGDAGIVVSWDAGLVERVRMLANYGERRRHESELRGHNSRLDELQAAVLSVKLGHLEEWTARRRERAEQYLRTLTGRPGLGLPAVTDGASPVWHQFVVRMASRDSVHERLVHAGIETLVHYPIPPHRAAAYAADYPEPLPITERLAASVLSLPMSPHLSEADCGRVCEALLASIGA